MSLSARGGLHPHQQARALADADAELKAIERQVQRHQAALRKHLALPETNARALVELNEAMERATEIRRQITKLQAESLVEGDVTAALSSFGPVWQQLSPREQVRVIQLLVERVEYDGESETVSVTFHPNGISAP